MHLDNIDVVVSEDSLVYKHAAVQVHRESPSPQSTDSRLLNSPTEHSG